MNDKNNFILKDGSFVVGPIKQWHYLVYWGSPGKWPFPDALGYLGLPAEIRIVGKGYEDKRLLIDINGDLLKDEGIRPEKTDCSCRDDVIVKLNRKVSPRQSN